MVNIFTAMKLGVTFCTNISAFYCSRRAQSAAPTCTEGTRDWVPNHQILRDSMKLLAKLYSLCFWCCGRPRRKFLLCLREWTGQHQKGLEKQNTPSAEMALSENDGEALGFGFGRCENKASGALRQHQLKNINISLKYLIYLITTPPPKMFFGRNFKGNNTCFGFFSSLSIQLILFWKAMCKTATGEHVTGKLNNQHIQRKWQFSQLLTIFNGLHSKVVFLF